MKREFLINLLILISINLLIKPIFIFGIDLSVNNIVGPEQYGLYFTILNSSYLMLIFNDFGIQNFNNRNIAQHNHLLDKYFPNIIILKTILGFVYLISTILLCISLGYWQSAWDLVLLLAINQVLVSFIQYCRTNISGLGFYRIDSLLSALDRLLMIVFCAILIFSHTLDAMNGIRYFVYAQTAAYVLTFLIAFSIVFRKVKRFKLRFNLAFLLLIIKKSFPYALIALLMSAYTRVDGVMLAQMLPDGKTEVGIYASAYRLLEASNSISLLFAGLLLPMFARMLGERESVYPLVGLSSRVIAVISISAAVCFSMFSMPIMARLYPLATPYWAETLSILIWSFVPISFMYIFGTLLVSNGSVWVMNRIFMVGVVLNLILNYVLISAFKAHGAAWSAVITQVFVAVSLMWTSANVFDFKINKSLIIKILCFLFLINLSALGFQKYISNWLIAFLMTGFSSLIFAFALGILEKDVLLNFRKKV